ncbi:MAG: hypothetical protein WCI48_07315 [Bacteroidota bacterium]|jgi:hypothetical protein
MKTIVALIMSVVILLAFSANLQAQQDPIKQDFGISAGGFSNFPANQHYMTDLKSVVYVSPYIQVGRHEFSLGFAYPVAINAMFFSDDNINPSPGFIAGYKFYVFNPYFRENMFIHYSFEYLRYKSTYNKVLTGDVSKPYTETDMYINNVIGLGYNVYFDSDGRFGLYYILDYLVSQNSYKINGEIPNAGNWMTNYVWNNLSTHIGLTFKLTSLRKKVKK